MADHRPAVPRDVQLRVLDRRVVLLTKRADGLSGLARAQRKAAMRRTESSAANIAIISLTTAGLAAATSWCSVLSVSML